MTTTDTTDTTNTDTTAPARPPVVRPPAATAPHRGRAARSGSSHRPRTTWTPTGHGAARGAASGDELEVFDDAVDPRLRARWIEARRAEGRRRLYVLCGIAGTVALVVIAYVIAHSSLLGAGSIEVHGVPAAQATAIRTAADIPDGAPLLFLDEGAVARRVEALPTVARAQVSTELPSTVVIRVTERTPVAWTRTVLTAPPIAVLDGAGRVLARTDAPPPGLAQVAGVGVAGAPGSHVARTGRAPRARRTARRAAVAGRRAWCCARRTARCSCSVGRPRSRTRCGSGHWRRCGRRRPRRSR